MLHSNIIGGTTIAGGA